MTVASQKSCRSATLIGLRERNTLARILATQNFDHASLDGRDRGQVADVEFLRLRHFALHLGCIGIRQVPAHLQVDGRQWPCIMDQENAA